MSYVRKRTKHIPQTIAKIKKYDPNPMVLSAVRTVEAIMAANTLLQKVAIDIAFARILIKNTSLGINHAPGPIPIEKNDM